MTRVHILATVRKPELLPAALLVFHSLRIGFPTAEVLVWGNNLLPMDAHAVAKHTVAIGGSFRNDMPTTHDTWIETLITNERSPFWILDTDVVFWKNLEADFSSPTSDICFAGRFEPEFHEEWTNTIHAERLHTCVQYFNPALVRAAMRSWMGQFPPPFGQTAQCPLIKQHFIPRKGELPLLYDSTAGLWQAGIGTAFTPAQNDCFDHLGCATYADLIDVPSLKDLRAMHAMVFEDPSLAMLIRETQQKYYATRATAPNAPRPTPEASTKD